MSSTDIRPQVIDFKNGKKVVSVFSHKEIASRITKLRGYMVKNSIDRVLFTSIHNINYYSGFLYCSFGRPYGLVISHENHTTISANIDAGQPWRRSFSDNIVYTDWQQDNYFRALKKLIFAKDCLGVENDHITIERQKKLQKFLPDISVVDISYAVMSMRMIKSEEEQLLITQGARISDIGGNACVEAIAEGVPEYEVALHSTRAMVRAIANTYPNSELMDTWTWFQSGINTDGAHNPVTTRRIQKGDILSLNCFSMISGYYQALERTLFYHSVTEKELKLWQINCEVHKKGMELIRPGVLCCDVAKELNEIYAQNNLIKYRTFGYGHSFGSLCHYYGREAGLELREDIKTVIKPGMVISMEPMVTVPEGTDGAGGYREHNILIVTDDGTRDITKFPFGAKHNVIS